MDSPAEDNQAEDKRAGNLAARYIPAGIPGAARILAAHIPEALLGPR